MSGTMTRPLSHPGYPLYCILHGYVVCTGPMVSPRSIPQYPLPLYRIHTTHGYTWYSLVPTGTYLVMEYSYLPRYPGVWYHGAGRLPRLVLILPSGYTMGRYLGPVYPPVYNCILPGVGYLGIWTVHTGTTPGYTPLPTVPPYTGLYYSDT